jgi:hypothetical protein
MNKRGRGNEDHISISLFSELDGLCADKVNMLPAMEWQSAGGRRIGLTDDFL